MVAHFQCRPGFTCIGCCSLINDSRGSDVCWRREAEAARLVVLDTVLNAEQLEGQACRKAWPAALDCMWLWLPLPTSITIPASSCMCVPEFGELGCTAPLPTPATPDVFPFSTIINPLPTFTTRQLHFQAQVRRCTNISLVSKLTAQSLTF